MYLGAGSGKGAGEELQTNVDLEGMLLVSHTYRYGAFVVCEERRSFHNQVLNLGPFSH